MSPHEPSEPTGTLYLVASPIGNLGDVSRRTTEVLTRVDAIVAEDTRRARKLLTHLGIAGKPVARFDAHANDDDVERATFRLRSGQNVALLTDAGTPSVSDPGAALVRSCHALGLPVVPIPGPSAVTCAIAASGLVEGAFWFVGFLPRTGSKRQRWLDRIEATEEPVVLFEAANRIRNTVEHLAERQPERMLCIARELTKKFEQVELRSLADWRESLTELRGELTLVLGPGHSARVVADAGEVDQLVLRELSRGLGPKLIAEQHHTALGMSKRDLYQRVLALRLVEK